MPVKGTKVETMIHFRQRPEYPTSVMLEFVDKVCALMNYDELEKEKLIDMVKNPYKLYEQKNNE